MVTYYRVIYRDGSHGSWCKDKAFVEHCAKKFWGWVESKEFEL